MVDISKLAASTMEKENIETSLINSISSDNIKEIVVDAAELSLDQFLEDGVIKDIPIFGTLYKAFKTTQTIRDAIFAKKLFKFLTQLKDIPQDKRKAFVDKIEEKEGEKVKVGQKLLVIIEQLDDIDKAEIIGNLFCATINEKIEYENFLRLSAMVQRAFLPDLLKIKEGWGVTSSRSREHLYMAGLLTVTITEDMAEKRARFDNDKPGNPIFGYEENNWTSLLRKFGFNTST